MAYDTVPTVIEDEDEADHCTCDLELVEDEATSDAELPPAVGGIEAPGGNADDDDDEHLDGCEIDFSAAEPTTDEELPVTVGGM